MGKLSTADRRVISELAQALKSNDCAEVKIPKAQWRKISTQVLALEENGFIGVKIIRDQTSFTTMIQASLPISMPPIHYSIGPLTESYKADVEKRNKIYRDILWAFSKNGLDLKPDGKYPVPIRGISDHDFISNGGRKGGIYSKELEDSVVMASADLQPRMVARYEFEPIFPVMKVYFHIHNTEKVWKNVVKTAKEMKEKTTFPPPPGYREVLDYIRRPKQES
jgi:hypothetical protein